MLAVPLAALLDLSPLLLLAAAAAAPTAGLLALDRGRLYGLGRRRAWSRSLLAEPAVRLTLGVALAAVAGAVGGAIAVVVAGWAALAVAHLPARAERCPPPSGPAGVQPGGAVAAFLLLAVVQNQDVLLANALLDADEAGRFAVLSTLGGVAAFATTTVPLMLLPRAARAATRCAPRSPWPAVLGLGAVAVVARLARAARRPVFGDRYASVGAVAVPYVLAMALLGVARVLVADACAQRPSRARRRAARAGRAAARRARARARRRRRGRRHRDARPRPRRSPPAPPRWRSRAGTISLAVLARRDVLAVAAIAAGGLVLRLLATRGIWLDEATSI